VVDGVCEEVVYGFLWFNKRLRGRLGMERREGSLTLEVGGELFLWSCG